MPFEDRTTNLDLNGPNIEIKTDAYGHEEGSTTSKTTVNPFGADASRTGGTIEITGIGTASWGDPTGFSTYATNTGTIGYQWYKLNIAGVGEPLGISTRWEGQTTDTLKLKYLDSPTDNLKQYYVKTRILPSAYAQPEGATVTAGTARSTGFAINETVDSGRVTVTVLPELTLDLQPTNQSATINNTADFNVSASVTDNTSITYQWYVDGNRVSNGDLISTNFAQVKKEKYSIDSPNGRDNSITIPDDATNVVIRVGAGAGGYGGTDNNGGGGAGGYGRVGYFNLPDGGRTLTIRVGQRGGNANSGTTDPGGSGGTVTDQGDGGNGGTGGNSGTGGGGASGCYVYDGLTSTWIIAAGGGGGGGGGSWNRGGNGGNNAGDWQAISGTVERDNSSNGGNGSELGGGQGSDGGGGGGGGGGYRGGNGGSAGRDVLPPPPPLIYGCTDPGALNYNPSADRSDGSCRYPDPPVRGCTDSSAKNYNASAEVDDGSCQYPTYGCKNPRAVNADMSADIHVEGWCVYPYEGCKDLNALNFDPSALAVPCDNCCIYPEPKKGCTDSRATNYDPSAEVDDGSCIQPPREGCTDLRANNFSILAVVDDGSCTYPPPTRGCTDSTANNYDPFAQFYQAGSCTYDPVPVPGCTDSSANNYNASATEDDGTCTYPAPVEDDDDEDGCFVGTTRVVMRSPTTILSGDLPTEETKPISEILVGDYVMNKDNTEANKVVFVEKRTASGKVLYAPKPGEKPFATKNHMLYVDGKWIHADGDQYPWLEDCELVSNVVVEPGGEQVLYNLWVTGDGSYIVNGYGTHSIMFDGGFMKNAHDQGLLGYDDVLLLMEEFTEQKPDLLYGSFLVNRLLGKVNVKLLNRLWVNILCAEDSTKRKKTAHLVMKILQKIRRII